MDEVVIPKTYIVSAEGKIVKMIPGLKDYTDDAFRAEILEGLKKAGASQ